jgi:protein phosphatase
MVRRETMPIISAHKNDIGRNRKRENEDYIWFDDQAGLYIVADGMGGQEAGEIASQLAADTVGQRVVERLKTAPGPLSAEKIQELIINSIEAANAVVYQASQDAGHKRGMGTTIVLALVQSNTAYVSHAGDSRAYLAKASTLTQLTEDDSWAVWGQKNLPKAKIAGNILTKAIGQHSSVDPSFTKISLAPGDCLLLCSDGLWNMLDDNQILDELDKAGDQIELAVEGLVAAANDAGGSDNISVILIKYI